MPLSDLYWVSEHLFTPETHDLYNQLYDKQVTALV
jgi:hypothetical protein